MISGTETIHSLKLQGPSSGQEYDLASVSCSWAVNGIPSATCRVLTGRRVLGDKGLVEWDSNPGTRGQLWTIRLRTSARDEQLFTGTIAGVSQTQGSSAHGSRVILQVTLVGPAAKLARMNAAAYLYWNMDNKIDGKQARRISPLLSRHRMGASDIRTTLTTPSQTNAVKELTGFESWDPDSEMQRFLLAFAAYVHDKASTEADLDFRLVDYFKSDVDIAFAPATGRSIDKTAAKYRLSDTLNSAYMTKWSTSSLWEAILGACSTVWVSVVPLLDGRMELVPLLPWSAKADLEIGAALVLGLKDTTDGSNLLYAPEQVRVKAYIPQDTHATAGDAKEGVAMGVYPPDSTAGTEGKIMQVNIPSWLAAYDRLSPTEPVSAPVGAPAAGGDTILKRTEAQREPEQAHAEQAATDKQLPTLTEQLAKMYYAQYNSASRSITLDLPWHQFRLVQALGAVAKLDGLDLYGVRGSLSFYGMVNAMTLDISRGSGEGRAGLQVQLTHVRDSGANARYGLESNPVYAFDMAARIGSAAARRTLAGRMNPRG